MTLDAFVYFLFLALWSAGVAYALLFVLIPYFFGKKKGHAKQAHHAPAHHAPAHHAPHRAPAHHPRRRRFSAHEGFRSFAEGVELTVEDIVKGLARED